MGYLLFCEIYRANKKLSGGIWRILEASGNIWEASGSICKAADGIWEASGLLDGLSPDSRRSTGHGLVGDVDNGFWKKASLAM